MQEMTQVVAAPVAGSTLNARTRSLLWWLTCVLLFIVARGVAMAQTQPVTITGPSMDIVEIPAGQDSSIPFIIRAPAGYAGPIPSNGVYYEIHAGLTALGKLVSSGYNLQLVNGIATIPVPAGLDSGPYVLLLHYNGDSTYLASTNPTLAYLHVGLNVPNITFSTEASITYGTTLSGAVTSAAKASLPPKLNYMLAQVRTNPNWEALAIPPSSPLVRVEGCAESSFIVVGSTWPANLIWHCETAQSYQRPYRIGTIVNSDFVDFLFDGQGDSYRIWVDGVASGYFATETDNVGNFDEYRIAFNDGKPHRLEIESDGDFIGLIPAGGSSGLQAPDWPIGPEVAWFSNSFGEPTITGNYDGHVGFVETASDLIGWNNISNFSEGGTDYINYVPGRTNYLGHMAGSDGCSRPFDAYVFAGGLNDQGYTMAEEQTAAFNTYQAALVCSPKAVVLVFGPIPAAVEGYYPSLQVVDSGIQAAVAQISATGAPVYYLASPGALGWYPQYPAGCTGSPGDPVYCTLSGDGAHPTQYWQQVIGSLIAPYIQSQAPGLTTVLTPEPLPQTALSQQQHRRPEVAGEWTMTTGATLVTGVGGDALSSLVPGDPIYVVGSNQAITLSILSIPDNNTVVLAQPVPDNLNAAVPSEIELATYPFPVIGLVPDAAIQVPGTFTYTSNQAGGDAEGVSLSSVLNAGDYSITANFVPADATDYASAKFTAPLTVTQATPTNVLLSSANPALESSAVNFIATVASVAGTPTGTVSFYDGTTLLGSGTLIAGTGTFSSSALVAGVHSITAEYSGDSNFVVVTSGALTETIENFTVSLPTGGTTATTQPGGQATYTLGVAPTNGTRFADPITFSVTGLPTGATAAFSPATIPAGAGATNVILTVTLPNTTAVGAMLPVGKPFVEEMLPVALGLILLPIAGRLRRGSRRLRGTTWLILLAGAVAMAGLTSCGGGSGGGSGGSIPQPQNYTLTIAATSGLLSNTTTVTLTVE